jgi:hypothetical protein
LRKNWAWKIRIFNSAIHRYSSRGISALANFADSVLDGQIEGGAASAEQAMGHDFLNRSHEVYLHWAARAVDATCRGRSGKR